MGFIIRKIILGACLVLCSLSTQGQVASLGLELNDGILRSNPVTVNDTVAYIPGFANEPRFAYTGMIEWRIRDKSS